MKRRYLRRYRNPSDLNNLLDAFSKFEDGGKLQQEIFDGWTPPRRRFRRNPEKFKSALFGLKALVQMLLNVRITDVSDQDAHEFKIYYNELDKQVRRIGI